METNEAHKNFKRKVATGIEGKMSGGYEFFTLLWYLSSSLASATTRSSFLAFITGIHPKYQVHGTNMPI